MQKPHLSLGFRTKRQAIATFSAMLNSATLGKPLADPILTQLIVTHPRAADKVGPGVSYVYVDSAAFGSRCFHIMRVDGTHTDFSYRKCL